MKESKSEREFAGFWVRFGSVSVDGIIIIAIDFLFLALFSYLFHSFFSTGGYLKFILFMFLFLSVLFAMIYFAWFNADGRQSPGKKVFGIAVVDTSFHPIPLSRSFFRTFLLLCDTIIFGLGNLMSLFNRKKQTLHDFFSGTYVVLVTPKRRLEPVVIIIVIVVGFMAQIATTTYIRKYVQAFSIPTGGLKPTILVGDFIFVDKYWPRKNLPKQGDLIVFKYPRDESIVYMKRCIAVGGQTVELKEGDVFIDGDPEGEIASLGKQYDHEDGANIETFRVGQPNREPYAIRHYANHNLNDQVHNFGPVKVPDGYYFVMGDNRDNSADSRSWGVVSQESVIGKAGLIYFSWDKSTSEIRWSRIGQILH